jgi:hypothetical protein
VFVKVFIPFSLVIGSRPLGSERYFGNAAVRDLLPLHAKNPWSYLRGEVNQGFEGCLHGCIGFKAGKLAEA